MKSFIIIMIFNFISVICFTSFAYGKITKNVTTQLYEISPSTLQDIPKLLKTHSPAKRNSPGYTEYFISILTRKKSTRNYCQIEDTKIELNIKYILPQLSQSTFLNSRDLKIWHQYRNALETHEKGHGEIGEKIAKQAQKIMSSNDIKKRLFGSCEKIDIFTNRILKLLIGNSNEDQLYDLLTNHGALQGAHLSLFAQGNYENT